MEALIVYIIKVAICLGIFLSVYAVFLRKTTFFKFNRFFLLFGFVASSILPFITLRYDVIVPAYSLMSSSISLETVVAEPNKSFGIWEVLLFVFLIGILLLL